MADAGDGAVTNVAEEIVGNLKRREQAVRV